MQQRLRVLMGVPQKGLSGGPPGHLPYLVEGLQSLDVSVIPKTYASRVHSPSVVRRCRDLVTAMAQIVGTVRRDHIDVVHLNTAFDLRTLLRDFATVLSLRPFGKILFLKIHGADGRLITTSNPVLRLLTFLLFRMVDGLGVLSPEEMKSFVARGVPSSKVFVVKNILKPEQYVKNRTFHSRCAAAEELPLILFISRFKPEKGLIDVIRAMKIVIDGGHHCKLLCIGDGSLRAEAERLSQTLGLEDHVAFLGHIPEESTKEYYANCDLLVFPTFDHEGFAMSLFQSVAAGLPIVTTRIRAAAHYLKEPENCLWVEPHNPAMLAQKIAFLLDRPDLRESMSHNNKSLALQFSQYVVANEFLEIYQSLIETRRARSGFVDA